MWSPVPANREILHGVARATLLDVAADLGLELELRPFTVAEAYEAREAFLSSASMRAMPVIEIDGRVIGDGRPGEVTLCAAAALPRAGGAELKPPFARAKRAPSPRLRLPSPR